MQWVKNMEYASLSSLIESLERGTNLHICVTFLDNCGNGKTRCTTSQTIHDRPVCKAVKSLPNGLVSCYRCRNIVQKALVRRKRPMAGFCSNGVYEYCRPVIYDGRVTCVIFVGNILTQDPLQRQKLEKQVDSSLLATMESHFSREDCLRTADILESYIHFLFQRYGRTNDTHETLTENIKNYIRENLNWDLSLEELAAVFNYTPKYLGRVFKQRTGMSVNQYRNVKRVDQAKILLTESDLSIERIAAQAGFNSVSYFDRKFYKVTGLSPQMYRKSVKQQKSKKP